MSSMGFNMLKTDQNFFSSKCNNLYTIRKPMLNLVDLCCFQKFYTVIWVKKIEKYENDEFWIKLT
jgi:hypothetical protein